MDPLQPWLWILVEPRTAISAGVGRSIVVARLEKLDAVLEDLVDEAVSLIDPARPDVAAEMLERFRLAESAEGVPQDGFHQIEHPKRGFSVGLDPMAEILQALVLDYRVAPGPWPGAQPSFSSLSSRRRVARSVAFVRARRARVRAASSRTAFWGDRSR